MPHRGARARAAHHHSDITPARASARPAHRLQRRRIMLAWIGAVAIVALFGLIITKRLSPLVALIVVPVAASLAAGFGLQTGKFVVHGVQNIGPIAGMFVFAILFFGILTDAGMLDPIIAGVLRVIGCHPPRIVMGSALLALLIHLDGSGA
ncbi:citrate transporter, partial [Burkholderia cenocepacia]